MERTWSRAVLRPLGPKHLSTAIDTGDGTASVALAMSVAPMLRLSAADAGRVLREVGAAVRPWREVAARWLTPTEVERMAPAFAELDAVPGLL